MINRERLVHMLAIKPLTRAEILLRFFKENPSASDRDRETQAIDSLLNLVAVLNPKTSAYELNYDTMLNEVNDEWHFYSQTDKVYVKRAINKVKQGGPPPPPQQQSTSSQSSSQQQQQQQQPTTSPIPSTKNPLINSGPTAKQQPSSAFISIKQQQQQQQQQSNKSTSNLASLFDMNDSEMPSSTSASSSNRPNWPSNANNNNNNKISPNHTNQTTTTSTAATTAGNKSAPKSQLTSNRHSSSALYTADNSFGDLSISSSENNTSSNLSMSLNTSSKAPAAKSTTTTTTTTATVTSTANFEKENNHNDNLDVSSNSTSGGSSSSSGGSSGGSYGESASKKPKLTPSSQQASEKMPRDRQSEIEANELNECAKYAENPKFLIHVILIIFFNLKWFSFRRFKKIQSEQQKEHYLNEFNKYHQQYAELYSYLESLSKRFVGYQQELAQKDETSTEYSELKRRVQKEYLMLQSNKDYLQKRERYLQLHVRLKHIEELINEWSTDFANLSE